MKEQRDRSTLSPFAAGGVVFRDLDSGKPRIHIIDTEKDFSTGSYETSWVSMVFYCILHVPVLKTKRFRKIRYTNLPVWISTRES